MKLLLASIMACLYIATVNSKAVQIDDVPDSEVLEKKSEATEASESDARSISTASIAAYIKQYLLNSKIQEHHNDNEKRSSPVGSIAGYITSWKEKRKRQQIKHKNKKPSKKPTKYPNYNRTPRPKPNYSNSYYNSPDFYYYHWVQWKVWLELKEKLFHKTLNIYPLKQLISHRKLNLKLLTDNIFVPSLIFEFI